MKDVVANFGSGILVQHDQEKGVDDDDDAPPPMEIDRKKLGAIVFAERSAMAKLEAIVWPHVKTLLTDKIEQLRGEWTATVVQQAAESEENSTTAVKQEQQKLPIVVLEAAVLLDAGWEDMLDGVWAVTVPRKEAVARLTETRGLTSEEALKRIDAQESRRGIGNLQEEIDAGVVTGVLVNDRSLEDLERSLRKSLNDPNCWKISRSC